MFPNTTFYYDGIYNGLSSCIFAIAVRFRISRPSYDNITACVLCASESVRARAADDHGSGWE